MRFVKIALLMSFAAGCGKATDLQPSPTGPVAVATVTVAPSAAAQNGGAGYVSAVLRDSSGFILPDRAVTWSSSDSSVAIVSTAGYLTPFRSGQATITALSEGKKGTATIVVPGAAPVASVVITPDTVAVEAGKTWQLGVVTLDSIGHFA